MRVRLRPAYSTDELQHVYSRQYDHTRWPDHICRVQATIEFAKQLCPNPTSIADLSCGDAAIAKGIGSQTLRLGDLTSGYEFHGCIESTIHQLSHAELFILSETAEHLDNPDSVLAEIRHRADHLVLSTPISELNDSNPEHYWGWDHGAVRDMLEIAGWNPVLQEDLSPEPHYYNFQLWGCS